MVSIDMQTLRDERRSSNKITIRIRSSNKITTISKMPRTGRKGKTNYRGQHAAVATRRSKRLNKTTAVEESDDISAETLDAEVVSDSDYGSTEDEADEFAAIATCKKRQPIVPSPHQSKRLKGGDNSGATLEEKRQTIAAVATGKMHQTISETVEKALLQDIEQKGLPFDQISLVQLCDQREAFYGPPSSALRRAIQKHFYRLKQRTPKNYQKLLVKYSILPGPFTCQRLKDTEDAIEEPSVDKPTPAEDTGTVAEDTGTIVAEDTGTVADQDELSTSMCVIH
jgi:hypothetical protein